MKYIPPFGRESEGDDAQWVNGDPTIGRQGSIPPAAVFEYPQREIVNVISKSGFVPTDTPMPWAVQQLAIAVRSQALNYAEDTGSDSNISVAYDPPITTYTRGLTLHVRVRFENSSDVVRINAGAGNAFVRKMSGADVGAGQLPAQSLVTLIFDGTNFQLSNFGGAGGGAGDVFRVYIPYAVDNSPTPGTVRVWFSPPFAEEPAAGEVIAIKVAHTNPGPITIEIDNLQSKQMVPNGGKGDPALQGDITEGDVIILFYDGAAWWFSPNPEITANITYTVGPGQQFANLADGIATIRRKIIGANGRVTFRLIQGIFNGPLTVNHPSGDRIIVRGTMIQANPLPSDFQVNGFTEQQRNADAVFNINMLRGKYGTEVRIPNSVPGNPYANANDFGLINTGPGMVIFADLLVVGNQLPAAGGNLNQYGAYIPAMLAARFENVTVWGSQNGFVTPGDFSGYQTYAVNNSHIGIGGHTIWATECHAFGNGNIGFSGATAFMWQLRCSSRGNGNAGWSVGGGSRCFLQWCTSIGNGSVDLHAGAASNINFQYWPGVNQWGTTSPVVNVVGNLNSIITTSTLQP